MSEFLYINSETPINSCAMSSCYQGCNNNMASNNPATQYQRQKIIQNTVRVKSSLYTMNLGALNVYQKPNKTYSVADNSGATYIVSPGVNWNQMSDRKDPHVQVVVSGSGSTYGASSTRRTTTRLRPGALSPGGSGVDIKHNSYERYLNRIKGKAPVRRGPIPPTFGEPYIPFNRAFPIYGGKTIKTSIVSGCNCPDTDADIINSDKKLYENSDIQNQILDVTYTYNVADFVWAKKYYTDTKYEKATIISIVDGVYTVKFEDGIETALFKCELLIYYNCNNCSIIDNDLTKEIDYSAVNTARCFILTTLSNGEIL
jgi:hypothetical protein